MSFDAIILAAGNSVRAGGNKMAFTLGDETLLSRTVRVFCDSPRIDKIVLVMRKAEIDVGLAIASEFGKSKFKIVVGGSTRADSVINGLSAVDSEYVLIHDGARPFITENLIELVCVATEKYGSGVPALPISDSVRAVKNGIIVAEGDRESVVRVQTPQGYLTKKVLDMYLKARSEGYTPADESVLYAKYSDGAHTVIGEETNVKITTKGDYLALGAKVGIGVDLHRLVPYRKLMLGGIEVAHELGELAHSDGDVVIHAIIDALLSALGERDIGCRFPDSDPKYLDIDSAIMLSEVVEDCRKANKRISSCSVVIELERPKLAEYIPVMRVKLANILGTDMQNVAIAAKTGEGVGPIGEGLAVRAYASVVLI